MSIYVDADYKVDRINRTNLRAAQDKYAKKNLREIDLDGFKYLKKSGCFLATIYKHDSILT